MADRIVSELNTLSAAEDADLIYVVDDPLGTPLSRNIQVSDLLRVAHGEISIAASSSQTVAASTPTIVQAWDTTNGSSINSTPGHTLNRIVADVVGVYRAILNLSVQSASAQTVDAMIYWNGSQVGGSSRVYTDGTNVAFLSVTAIVDVTVILQNFEAYFQNSAGAQVTFLFGQLSVQRIY